MSLETPIKIRMLQKKLYQKAKEEPSYRFYLLYDKMYREDVLAPPKQRPRQKKSAEVTLFFIRDAALTMGLVHYKTCSVNETWSAMLFARKQ